MAQVRRHPNNSTAWSGLRWATRVAAGRVRLRRGAPGPQPAPAQLVSRTRTSTAGPTATAARSNRSAFPTSAGKGAGRPLRTTWRSPPSSSMADGVDAGLWLDEPADRPDDDQADGHLAPSSSPGAARCSTACMLLRGDVPLREFRASQPAVVGLACGSGPKLFRTTVRGGFLPAVRAAVPDELKMPLVLLGGINRRDTVDQAMARASSSSRHGRALLRNPTW